MHFHEICREVFEKENLETVFDVLDVNAAQERAVLELPNAWEGSTQVGDDATWRDKRFPFTNFWRTPLS